ncbi:type IV pilus modification PilV family protein [Halanaerobium hydrogeniformans]|uniref:Prepilin-type N-terminal cleavage/methylation domain-containing protein n=1 Tax=Halanaerobium hydrogeniformans TaxID=656519 RepID=E4RLF5_HALHG|nr:type II secretion system protein [Halanaerobium hydrogeniformans]ADQ14869.1 hypothetical protein Halsa_1442 [Halanaerobium hydrogeniformans]
MDKFKLEDKGFTLLEIILAIAVVGIVGVTFFGFFANSARVIKSVDVREKALMLAQQEMEGIKAGGFSGINNEINNENYFDDNYKYFYDEKSINSNDGFPEYKVNILVEKEKDSLYKLTVTSDWTENSIDKNIELISYVSSRGD